jgi:hypothetical protein
MGKQEVVTLETVVGLAGKLSAPEKLKLVERVLVDLEPVVQAQEPRKRKQPRPKGKRQSLTEEQEKEIKRKLWGVYEQEWPTQVVRLEGLWKDTPLRLTDEDFRQASHELSEALKRRAERVLE